MMNAKDNVATALERVDAGDLTSVILPSQEVYKELTAKQSVPVGHKFALAGINSGDKVIKYGESIGTASRDIELGEYVHVHNVRSDRMQMPEVWYREET
jgi:altronate dehydratase